MAIYEILCDQIIDQFEFTNRFYLNTSTVEGIDPGDLNVMFGNAYAILQPTLSTFWALVGIRYRPIDGSGIPFLSSGFTPITGQSAGELEPASRCAVVFFRANSPRPNKAWKFVRGWNEGANDSGRIIDGSASLLQQWANYLNTTFNGGVYSYEHVTARVEGDPSNVVDWNELVSAKVATSWRYRKDGRGGV